MVCATHHRSVSLVRLVRMIAVGLLCAAVTEATAQQPEAQTVRILTYNIHHGEGIDGKLDLPRIAGVIKSVQPDVVALQEVDVNTQRTGKVDQAAELARLTGLRVVFEQNLAFQGGSYGNAILSRWKIHESRNTHLPRVGDSEQRGVLQATIETPDGRTFRFLSTHLDHRGPHDERLLGAEAINRLVEDDNSPAVLAGDLNATLDSPVLERFRRQWTLTSTMEHPTIPVAKPRRQIDFILYRPARQYSVVELRVLSEAVASDHRAVLAVLRWNGDRP